MKHPFTLSFEADLYVAPDTLDVSISIVSSQEDIDHPFTFFVPFKTLVDEWLANENELDTQWGKDKDQTVRDGHTRIAQAERQSIAVLLRQLADKIETTLPPKPQLHFPDTDSFAR